MSSLLLKVPGVVASALVAATVMELPADASMESGRGQAIACTVPALVEAITDANGTRHTTITLPANCSYSLTEADNTNGTRGPNGLPMIRQNITLQGGTGTVIERAAGSPAFRLFEVGCGSRLTLRNVIVQGGDSGRHTGGAILNARGTVVLESSTVRRSAGDNGGGISNDTGELRLTASTVSDNWARGGGAGGIYNDGMLTMSGGTVARNRANTSGGGIYNEQGGTAHLSGTSVHHNLALLSGGALVNDDTGGAVTLRGNAIYANWSGEDGGAVRNQAVTTMTGANLHHNSSGADGGAIKNESTGRLTMVGGSIHYNDAFGRGGAISNATGGKVHLRSVSIGRNMPDNCSPAGTIQGCPGK